MSEHKDYPEFFRLLDKVGNERVSEWYGLGRRPPHPSRPTTNLWDWYLAQVAAREAAIRECDLEAAYREGFEDGATSESAFRRGEESLTASVAWARSETAERLAALLPPEERKS